MTARGQTHRETHADTLTALSRPRRRDTRRVDCTTPLDPRSATNTAAHYASDAVRAQAAIACQCHCRCHCRAALMIHTMPCVACHCMSHRPIHPASHPSIQPSRTTGTLPVRDSVPISVSDTALAALNTLMHIRPHRLTGQRTMPHSLHLVPAGRTFRCDRTARPLLTARHIGLRRTKTTRAPWQESAQWPAVCRQSW